MNILSQTVESVTDDESLIGLIRSNFLHELESENSLSDKEIDKLIEKKTANGRNENKPTNVNKVVCPTNTAQLLSQKMRTWLLGSWTKLIQL